MCLHFYLVFFVVIFRLTLCFILFCLFVYLGGFPLMQTSKPNLMSPIFVRLILSLIDRSID